MIVRQYHLVADNNRWSGLSDPGTAGMIMIQLHKEPYGALYNWFSVNTGNLCPLGWHVPTDSEWTSFIDFMAGESVAGGRLKENGTEHWSSPNADATDEKGFTALPGGERKPMDHLAIWVLKAAGGVLRNSIQIMHGRGG